MSLSILYLTSGPSPYKVSFFNELGLYSKLTVLFEKRKTSKRTKNWFDYNFNNFDGIFLDGIKIGDNTPIDLKITKHLSNTEYDIVVIGNYSSPSGILSILYLRKHNIPFVISVDGGLIDYEESKAKKRLKTYLISSADAWLSTGRSTNQYLEYYGANPEKMYIYPFTTVKKKNIVENELTLKDKKSLRDELEIPYKNMLLSVGRFIHSKGFDNLIKAAKSFNEDTGVYIIGGTPTDEYLDLINKNNINNVHFIDFLEYNELKKYYLATNIFVFPTREDVWGLVINEAMANGLPVITTTSCVAGIEMVEDGINGYLIPKNNINQIVEKTNHILADSILQKKMSRNSIEVAQEYTIENMSRITSDILKSIVSNL